MLLNSTEFLLFFLGVAIGYFAIPSRLRPLFLLAASFYFYLRSKPEYLILLIAITLVNFYAAQLIESTAESSRRKRYLVLSLCINLGILGFFKYIPYFSAPLATLFARFGRETTPIENILLPLGISFYLFKIIGYVLDVYRGRQKTEKRIDRFALFVSFFPTLVAGPIERAAHLLPQFDQDHKLDYQRITSGLILVTWGLFKKLVIADRLALIVNNVYNNPTQFTGIPLILATYFFAIQIYCDFSGYSDIAIGSAKVLGFDLVENFRQPYFSKSVSEFWRRWHISLSNWFRDYVFFPLERARDRKKTSLLYLNIMVVFFLTGVWHGSTANFIVWGGLQGLFIVGTMWLGNLRQRLSPGETEQKQNNVSSFLQIFITFHLILFSWIFFRANSTTDAVYIVSHLFSGLELRGGYGINLGGMYEMVIIGVSVMVLVIIDLLREKGLTIQYLASRPMIVRWCVYYALIFSILLFGKLGVSEFIYAGF